MKIRTYLATQACSGSRRAPSGEGRRWGGARVLGARSVGASGLQCVAEQPTAGVVVLHVAGDRSAYDRSHPGAVPPAERDRGRAGRDRQRAPAGQYLDSIFESVGVGRRASSSTTPLFAARAFFTLDYLGHGAGPQAGRRTGVGGGGAAALDRAPEVARFSRPEPERVVDAAWVSSGRAGVIPGRAAGGGYTGEVAGASPGRGIRRRQRVLAADDPVAGGPDVPGAGGAAGAPRRPAWSRATRSSPTAGRACGRASPTSWRGTWGTSADVRRLLHGLEPREAASRTIDRRRSSQPSNHPIVS